MEKYEAILIGGGYMAAGWLKAKAGKTLIICENIYPDEFSSCLRQATDECKTEVGKQLKEEFFNLGLIRNGIVDTVRGSKWICEVYEKFDADVLYNTFIKEYSAKTVTVSNDDGTTTFEADTVVDLRPYGDKYFWNIIVEGNPPGSIKHYYDDLSIMKIEFSGNFEEARNKLEILRKDRPELKIVIAATEAEIGDITSPFAAFEQGYMKAKEL